MRLLLALLLFSCCHAFAAPDIYHAKTLEEFSSADARQGVAVDQQHVYAINNVSISRHNKRSGAANERWAKDSPLIHLDSGMIWQGKLYAAHSNYPHWPMSSSIEIWDAETLTHIGNHSFGIHRGSLTWLDRYDGYWWAAFGNYDKVQKDSDHAYGETKFTQLVKMDDAFRVLAAWTLPPALLKKMVPMSNSGGSWGPDGLLYLTGHDHGELYVMQLPQFGSELQWVALVKSDGLYGQGIAWDRSSKQRILWGIRKKDKKLVKLKMPLIGR